MLASKRVAPHFICASGPNVQDLRRRGWPTIAVPGLAQVDNSAHGYYRGWRWLILLREAFLFPVCLFAILLGRLRWGGQIDVIHANEFSLVPIAAVAGLLFQRPVVVHVRTKQRESAATMSRLLYQLASRSVSQVVAIDSAVAETLPAGLSVEVVNNGETIRALQEPPVSKGREALPLRIGLVANFQLNKGVLDFIDAAEICTRTKSRRDITFQIVGDSQVTRGWVISLVRRLLGVSHDAKKEALTRIADAGLAGRIELRGFVADPVAIYSLMDVVCFPSHLDAVGRPVFEGATFGLPSVVTLRRLRSHDSIVAGVTGIVVPEKQPWALAEAFCRMADDRSETRQMGRRAYALAADRFDLNRSASDILHLYERLRDSGTAHSSPSRRPR